MLCLDVLQVILELVDFKTQLNLISLDKSCYENLKIINLDDHKITKKMTQEIIMQKKYNSLKYLDISNNSKIYSINHLKSLIKLDCGWNSGIDQEGIKDLTNLQILYASWNEKIYSVNHLKSLITLHCRGDSGVDQEGIKDLNNLQILYADYNKKMIWLKI